ncbi:MAG: glycine zipper 2TM domain-containing protein [Sulfuricurvum sp.]|nr:glycine zipper 2TM domain-containing protein [Sulfuricurvum sp.]MDD5386505.1 glycine zipper 2TM domain-containing protein [Sulfuricurvum sp.]
MKKIVLSASLIFVTTALLAQSAEYGSQAQTNDMHEVEYVPVTHSEPVYSAITKNIPHEVCEDQQVAIQQQSGGNNIVGALVGGAIGGVLGHQIGGGSGKVAATIGGAALGTMMGQNADRDTQTRYQTIRRCFTQYDTQTDTVMTGYMNYAKFHGRDIAKMSSQPLKEIKVINTFSF